MKRLCSIAIIALIAAGAHAQQAGNRQLPSLNQLQPENGLQRPTHPTAQQSGEQRDLLFSEDFANGLAGNNGMGQWTVSGQNGDIWKRSTAIPTGAYNGNTLALESPTASNGFMVFNSDSINSDYAVDPPVALTTRTNVGGSLVSPIIDLSAAAAVEIRFTQQFRFCCDPDPGKTLEISTDGGITWPTSIDIGQGTGANTTFPSTEVAFNITDGITANPANVRLRFTEGLANSAYYWMLDDISINSLPENELIMDYGYTSQFGGGYEYGRVPQSQLQNTLNVGAGITNYGSNTQNNVTVYVSLKDANDVEVGSSTIDLGTIDASGASVADAMMTIPSPLPVGLYTATFTMSSDSIGVDENVSNNSRTRYFEVTTDLYSLDAVDVVPDADLLLTSSGTNSFTDNTQDVRFLNYFEIHTQQTFTGVEVYVSSQTQPGSYFIAAVYDTADVLAATTDLSSPLVESDPRIITTDDMVDQRPAVSFLSPITLAPGAYYVSANLYQEGGNDIRVLDDLTVPQPNLASLLYLPIDDAGPTVYGNGNAWCVRLSSLLNVGVQEAPGLEGVSMSPSPTAGPLDIRTRTTGSMTVEVFNTMGALVQRSSFNGTATTLDLAGNAAGIYMVRVGDGTNFNMQRIVLK